MRLTIALIVGFIGVVPYPGWAEARSLEDLGPRVRVGSQVRVEERSGSTIVGRLEALSAAELTLKTDAGVRRVPVEKVTAIAVRRTFARRGALVGAGAGAVAGIVGDREHHDFDLPALLGAGAGAIVGALMPRFTTVYRRPASEASLLVDVSPRGATALAALRW